MEQVQHHCMEDFVHGDNEVVFPLDEEDDCPSLCDENMDHLEEENGKYELSTIVCDEIQKFNDHLFEDEIIESFLFVDDLS